MAVVVVVVVGFFGGFLRGLVVLVVDVDGPSVVGVVGPSVVGVVGSGARIRVVTHRGARRHREDERANDGNRHVARQMAQSYPEPWNSQNQPDQPLRTRA